MLAITLASPPHFGQTETSMLNTRFRRCAQVMDWCRCSVFCLRFPVGASFTPLGNEIKRLKDNVRRAIAVNSAMRDALAARGHRLDIYPDYTGILLPLK